MALFGTVAFAVLFSVPHNLYLSCGLTGALGFGLYAVLTASGMTDALATFFATLLVVLLARFLAVWRKAPATVFIVTGILPLVPGAGVYWTAYYLVTGQLRNALYAGFDAIKVAVAIVLGMVILFEIPNRFFHIGQRR
ncbi:MAG: threonine/serine exporter family protein [Clostridia bacterium]|nr:threonine/serine exporter family protein [Clostridia bacterium]